MAEEIDFENERMSKFQRHVTLTLPLDRAIWHTSCINHRSLPKFQISFESEKLFVDGWTYMAVRTDIEAGFIRSTPHSKEST